MRHPRQFGESEKHRKLERARAVVNAIWQLEVCQLRGEWQCLVGVVARFKYVYVENAQRSQKQQHCRGGERGKRQKNEKWSRDDETELASHLCHAARRQPQTQRSASICLQNTPPTYTHSRVKRGVALAKTHRSDSAVGTAHYGSSRVTCLSEVVRRRGGGARCPV